MINALFVSIALLAGADAAGTDAPAPKAIAPVNEATAAAQAVYLADAAASTRGDRSQLLVLGTGHLSGLPENFDRARFRPLLDRLKAWAPDHIAIEALSGAQCDYLRAYQYAYVGTAKDYCPDVEPARAALGLTGAAAEQEIETLLADGKTTRPAAERRHLAALFLAIGDPSSAVVQWLRLPEAERVADGALTADLVAYLNSRMVRRNENIIIAATLAAELGHERVYPVDDHTGDRATGPIADEDAYGRDMMAAWDNEWTKIRREGLGGWDKRLAEDASAPVLDWYRLMNAPEEARRAVASDFGAAAGSTGASGAGRKYLAYWETRNMRMAANIRELIGPKARVLAIVGASHKAYYERYLGVTSDLEIVDIMPLLD
ncbi:MAG: hypothetical protein EP335_12765 [Alphaproteobacteria bacterium]|nr:MAG: hypothetical protein EP335_12765 [Alphaproteobacteria bacterium]